MNNSKNHHPIDQLSQSLKAIVTYRKSKIGRKGRNRKNHSGYSHECTVRQKANAKRKRRKQSKKAGHARITARTRRRFAA